MRRTRKPVFHKSNIFIRDIQHAIQDYFETNGPGPVSRPEAERMATEVVSLYIGSGILRQVDNQAFTLNLQEFGTPDSGTYAMLTIEGGPMPRLATSNSAAPVGVAICAK
ncbi:MAG: hypothetical protein Q8922_11645 [Bacteroidota bacterium]|nr:hypothetical protein [Bacteroidota bacterium]MDP4234665.1 hypothetical protein [Bacteroidota bacterium]MDP4243830.1 hypothetical protein [Bacteroidota bacterium]MDP4288579.1 hypothetical protein [Bacteroidota bacterium]